MLKSGAVRLSEPMDARTAKLASAKSARARHPPGFASPSRVALVGTGRLGATLARALNHAGYRIDLMVARHAASAARAAKLLENETESTTFRQLMNQPSESLFHANLILICTPDDAIAKVAGRLSEILPKRKASGGPPVALHTSGALSSKVLEPLVRAGFAIGSIHPLISVAAITSPISIFSGAHFCVEGAPAGVRAARSIVAALHGRSFTVDTEVKPLYHAAAVMASGNVVALLDVGIDLLKRCGLGANEAKRALLPLLESTIENLKAGSPAAALTGPFARGDIETARKHLDSLMANKLSEAIAIYIALGEHALKISQAARPSLPNSDAIATLLSQFQHSRAR